VWDLPSGLRSAIVESAPHKIKFAVSGCIRECAKAQCKDIGLIATGDKARPSCRKFQPVVDGNKTVTFDAREGVQIGAWQYAFVKRVPRVNSQSIFGVCACGCLPRHPTQSFKLSIEITRMLGHSARTGIACRHTRISREVLMNICIWRSSLHTLFSLLLSDDAGDGDHGPYGVHGLAYADGMFSIYSGWRTSGYWLGSIDAENWVHLAATDEGTRYQNVPVLPLLQDSSLAPVLAQYVSPRILEKAGMF